MFMFQNAFAPGTFESRYKVHSFAFSAKPELEGGGKIILPPSALDQLARLQIEFPMLFQLTNHLDQKRKTHCGVIEFTAEEGNCYIPYWMMQILLLEEGMLIVVKSATLPKGTYVKVQPHTTDFIDIANPRAVMENRFRNFSALTQGDVIKLEYNNKNFYLSILEVKPDRPYNAISIIETDVQLDFAPPLDQKEEAPPKVQSPPQDIAQPNKNAALGASPIKSPSFQAFTGSGFSLSGKNGASPAKSPANQFTKPPPKKDEYDSDDEDDDGTFKAFSGSGQKLKG
eukprot:TRINITY_DN5908_c0_g1_i1.p1 TRINITY_DN5908_c0_g1~~TRINITY_DN5908_c0_g1_i1.p1  ORF type:complete len:285 (-),score=77.82 TRINITY_DN5908_c0_g1_i1:30-884(-)